MNQFHTPSFGDEVFEMNETPMDQPHQQTASRRISRLSSLDHSTMVNDEEHMEHMDYGTQNTYSNNQVTGSQQLQHPQGLTHTTQQSTQQSQQSPPKPLAPFALFFRDTMTAIKQQNPSCTLDQITDIALNMWDVMDEKQKAVYNQRYEAEKREYVRQLRDNHRNQQRDESPANGNQQQQRQLESQSPPAEEAPSVTTTGGESTSTQSLQTSSDQILLLTEAAAVQKCTREQCNKPAIINPDWEDEYCSNECVVIHCRNVFTEWARSLQNSPT